MKIISKFIILALIMSQILWLGLGIPNVFAAVPEAEISPSYVPYSSDSRSSPRLCPVKPGNRVALYDKFDNFILCQYACENGYTHFGYFEISAFNQPFTYPGSESFFGRARAHIIAPQRIAVYSSYFGVLEVIGELYPEQNITRLSGISDYGDYVYVEYTLTTGIITRGFVERSYVSLSNRVPALDLIGSKTVDEGKLLQFNISGSDPDWDALTYSATNLPTGAKFDAATKTFSWTPDYTQAGVYIVRFTVSDGKSSASENVIITVNNVNRPPVLDHIGSPLC